jgi:choline dehydrogenase-like flavoprotein
MTPRTSPGSGAGGIVEAQIAVIGAGAIGIMLALELARSFHVLLVDSGTWRPDTEVQALGDAIIEDVYHSDMRLATQRRIGGATNLWGGRCVPFDPVDFDSRELIANAEWPLSYADVARYYQRACDWCRCGRAIFNALELPELGEQQLVPGFVDGEVKATDLERWSLPTNFRRVYGRKLRNHPNITLVTGFTCAQLATVPSGESIASAEARSLDGRRIAIKADTFILACGGVESARLLLVSSDRQPEGLGNASGHVGRWYMSHTWAHVAKVKFNTDPAQTIYGHERDADGVFVRRRMTFTPDLQKRERLLNAAVWLINPEVSDARHGNATLSLVYLLLASPFGGRLVSEAIREKHLNSANRSERVAHRRNVLDEWPSAAAFAVAFGWGRFVKPGRRLPGFYVPSRENTYPLDYHGEHVPSWDSYVALDSSRDALGIRRLRTHLAFSDTDVASVRRGLQVLGDSLAEQRLGRLSWLYDDVDAATRSQLYGGFHQSGVTRMSREPSDGVVDPNLAVHGVDNLYVASTGVLPTSSQANTTFVAIALALRLADHLRELRDGPGTSSQSTSGVAVQY